MTASAMQETRYHHTLETVTRSRYICRPNQLLPGKKKRSHLANRYICFRLPTPKPTREKSKGNDDKTPRHDSQLNPRGANPYRIHHPSAGPDIKATLSHL